MADSIYLNSESVPARAEIRFQSSYTSRTGEVFENVLIVLPKVSVELQGLLDSYEELGSTPRVGLILIKNSLEYLHEAFSNFGRPSGVFMCKFRVSMNEETLESNLQLAEIVSDVTDAYYASVKDVAGAPRKNSALELLKQRRAAAKAAEEAEAVVKQPAKLAKK